MIPSSLKWGKTSREDGKRSEDTLGHGEVSLARGTDLLQLPFHARL